MMHECALHAAHHRSPSARVQRVWQRCPWLFRRCITRCMLHVACCMLSVACCTVSVARCTLHGFRRLRRRTAAALCADLAIAATLREIRDYRVRPPSLSLPFPLRPIVSCPSSTRQPSTRSHLTRSHARTPTCAIPVPPRTRGAAGRVHGHGRALEHVGQGETALVARAGGRVHDVSRPGLEAKRPNGQRGAARSAPWSAPWTAPWTARAA